MNMPFEPDAATWGADTVMDFFTGSHIRETHASTSHVAAQLWMTPVEILIQEVPCVFDAPTIGQTGQVGKTGLALAFSNGNNCCKENLRCITI